MTRRIFSQKMQAWLKMCQQTDNSIYKIQGPDRRLVSTVIVMQVKRAKLKSPEYTTIWHSSKHSLSEQRRAETGRSLEALGQQPAHIAVLNKMEDRTYTQGCPLACSYQ